MNNSGAVLIYALLDPHTQAVRYVGQTHRTLKARLSQHFYTSPFHHNYVAHWICSLKKIDLWPTIQLLEEVSTSNWQEAEQRWIAHFRNAGARLTNSTAGGDGMIDPTPEVRAKISAALTGKTHRDKGNPAPETIAKLRAYNLGKPSAMKGRKHSAESIEKMRVSHKGQASPMKGKKHSAESNAANSDSHKGRIPWNKGIPLTLETRAKLSAVLKGRKMSAETVAKMSAARTGHECSEATKAKIGAANRGRSNPHKGEKRSPEICARISAGHRRRTAQIPLAL